MKIYGVSSVYGQALSHLCHLGALMPSPEDISSNFHKALKENITSYEMYNFGENTIIVNKS